ncbi:aldehyde dehydrogenase [Cryobacterium sp. Y57]|uniref:aldehyde dehydrogenase n=1 Tax=Cryobacterium sp. Y57 TaxID=2048287 RepID=UPI000CE46370|nr:aldehyde dehydrogenase [Cryobacterium sp. Y57]
MQSFAIFVNGVWRQAAGGRTFQSIEPFTGQPWATIPDSTEADVADAVSGAYAALTGAWRDTMPTERGRLMFALADILDENAEELAHIEARDNGKVLREMVGQARALSGWYRYFGGFADKISGRTIAADKKDFHTYTLKEPVGVVGAITAWNSPVLLLAYKLAPALAAGCTVVVKPSELASASTLKFAEYFERAGFPAGVLSVVTGGPAVGQALVAHPDVNMVSFTGSTDVGRKIGAAAIAHFAKVSLELGGKSANIVFADADLDKAVNGVIAGIYAAAGQTCMAGSRLLVHESIADELVARVSERARTIVVGDPLSLDTEMGPLIGPASVSRIHNIVSGALDDGADAPAGGAPLVDLGPAFYSPTVIDHVTPSMAIATTELFGPVIAVQRFSTEEEAIAIANSTEYGLAAGLWTENVSRAHRVADRLVAGTIWVNSYRTVSFAVPTSGRKNSGIGTENGIEAVDEFLKTKAVWINLSDTTRDPFTIG